MMFDLQLQTGYKVWFTNAKGDYVIGKGGAELLQAIDETHSIVKAIEILRKKLSYRKAWSMLQKIKSHIGGLSPVETSSGGKNGGHTILTKAGKQLLESFMEFEKVMNQANIKYQEKIKKK